MNISLELFVWKQEHFQDIFNCLSEYCSDQLQL